MYAGVQRIDFKSEERMYDVIRVHPCPPAPVLSSSFPITGPIIKKFDNENDENDVKLIKSFLHLQNIMWISIDQLPIQIQ